MLGSLVSRFRVVAVVLAFGIGGLGPFASNVAMAAQMQPAIGGMASHHPCPACPGDQHSGITPMCGSIGCWVNAALPAYGAPVDLAHRVVFAASRDAVAAGIATPPDPHPPRLFHT